MKYFTLTGLLLLLFGYSLNAQTTQKLVVHPLQEPQQIETLVRDSLYGGGGILSNIQYNIPNNVDGLGSF
jgi:hypothetical protein